MMSTGCVTTRGQLRSILTKEASHPRLKSNHWILEYQVHLRLVLAFVRLIRSTINAS
jgi:hypothetical protein